MNTTSKTLAATLVIAVAGAASLVLGQAPETAPRQEIVKLERVVIEGHRAQDLRTAKVERLPTVVIEGRRAAPETQVATAAKACAATVVC